MKTSRLGWLVAIGGLVCGAADAEAGLLTVDVFNGVTHLTVIDGSSGDLDPSPNSIIVKSSLLLSTFGTQIITGSGVTASSNLATALIDGMSSLSTNYIFKTKTGKTSDFTVTARQTGFVLPGSERELDISASFTFTKSGTLGAGSFQGSIGTTDGSSNVFDSLITTASTGNLPNSYSGSGTGTTFASGDVAFSMQNVMTAHLVSTANAVVQGQGTAIVTFVPPPEIGTFISAPEPESIMIFAAMLGPVALGYTRRRRNTA